MAADLRAARPEAPAGELLTPWRGGFEPPVAFSSEVDPVRVKKTRQNKKLEPGSDSIRAERAPAGAGRGCCQYDAVTSPYFSLYSGLLRGRVRRSAACAPGRFKGRYRADDAARPGNRLHHCADCRARRAIFPRLEPVPAALRG